MITIESKGNEIILFGRDDTGKAYVKTITDFEPYLYIESDDGEFITIDGKKVKMLIADSPKNVVELRNSVAVSYESDIRYVNRYIIDKIDEMPKEKIRLCYIDIETQRTEEGYENPFLGKNPILSVVAYDNFTKEYRTFCVGDTHKDEKEMLIDFGKYIKENDPDILIAWNGEGFDFPMLITRMKMHGIDDGALARDNGKSYVDSEKEKLHIYGRICFDLMKGYRKIAQGGRESWSLDYISKYEELGAKEVYTGELDDLYKNDIKHFIRYNKRDVELMVLIDEKLNIIDFFDELRRLCFARFEDVFMNTKLADSLCLKYARGRYILPAGERHDDAEKYSGAFVHTSEPKLHQNVAVMDFKSLYPSIMIGFNTSYETILPAKTPDCINAYDKYYYRKEPGIIPSIVGPILTARASCRKEMKKWDRKTQEYKSLDMKQYALKVIANSFYGVLGFKHYRLYKKEVAASITYVAQQIIKETMKWFENRGYKIVYGDTDSCFISMGETSIEDMVKINKEYNIYLQTYFRSFGVPDDKNIFELQFEKVYKTIFFKRKADGTGAKKKYAGRLIWKDGKEMDEFNVTGFESKRSDSPQCGRDLLADVLKMIVYESPKSDVDKYIEEFKRKLRKETPVEEIGLPIGLSKSVEEYANPIHIQAARYSNKKHNAAIKKGDKIKYVFVKNNDSPVVAFKNGKLMWPGYTIDYTRMIARIVDMKIEPLYMGLGWTYKMEENKEQTTLINFIVA